jgi:hypothetical protein
LLYSFLKAAKTETMEKWCVEYGITTLDQYDLMCKAEILEQKIAFLHKNPSLVHIILPNHELSDMMEGLQIMSFDESFIVTVNPDSEEKKIIALIVYEFFELLKMGKQFDRCYCGLYYVCRQKQHKGRAAHCPDCETPSRKKWEYLSEDELEKRKAANLKAVKRYREKLQDRKRAKWENKKADLLNFYK